MKMRFVWALVVLAMMTLFAVTCIRPNEPIRITFDSYLKIQFGMTRKQTEDILGGLARNECANPDRGPARPWLNRYPEEWWGPDAAIIVWFDLHGNVSDKEFRHNDYGPAKKPSLWDSIRSWLPW